MLPETLVTLIWTLDQSGSCCAKAADPQTSAAPTGDRTIQVRIRVLISLLLRKPPAILPSWAGTLAEARRKRATRAVLFIGTPPPRAFLPKNSDSLKNKSVKFFLTAKHSHK